MLATPSSSQRFGCLLRRPGAGVLLFSQSPLGTWLGLFHLSSQNSHSPFLTLINEGLWLREEIICSCNQIHLLPYPQPVLQASPPAPGLTG